MAISFNTGAKNSANTATSVTLAIPGTVAAGNVMIMALEVFTETSTPPTISFSGGGGTWTLVPMTTGTNPEVATAGATIWSYGYAYYRVATAGDIGATITITESGSAAGTTWLAVAMAAYAGANTSSPIDVAAGNNAQGTAGGTGPTVTTVTANDWALQLACVGINGAPLGGPGTSRENIVSSASVGAAADDGNAAVAAGTSIGGGSWTQAGNTSNWWSLFTIGLAPAGAATPAPVYPARQAIRAQVPVGSWRAGTVTSELAPGTGNIPGPVHGAGFGGGTGAAGGPVRNPTPGPAFQQAPQPARARIPQNAPRGRTSANPGGPVRNPTPAVTGPPFTPLRWPARIRPSLPPRGRTGSSQGGPVRNPVQGQQFLPAGQPAGGPVVLLRTGVAMSTPVPAPPPVLAGPAFRPAVQAVRARLPLQPLLRGRTSANPGSTPRNPTAGPAFFPVPRPVRAPVPQTFSKGRTASSPGGPVANPVHGPAFRQATSPARIRASLPPRGRIASNPGGPVRNPAPPVLGPTFFPAVQPARIRPSLPPRGRTAGAQGAPVRNPVRGAAFRQAVRPIRAVIPQNAPRGRIRSSAGGPVANIPLASPVFRLGIPYSNWDTGTAKAGWQ